MHPVRVGAAGGRMGVASIVGVTDARVVVGVEKLTLTISCAGGIKDAIGETSVFIAAGFVSTAGMSERIPGLNQ